LRRRPSSSTLFPYTTLFRSRAIVLALCIVVDAEDVSGQVGFRIEPARLLQVRERTVVIALADVAAGAQCASVDVIRLEPERLVQDRKSTRLNSSHVSISYAV